MSTRGPAASSTPRTASTPTSMASGSSTGCASPAASSATRSVAHRTHARGSIGRTWRGCRWWSWHRSASAWRSRPRRLPRMADLELHTLLLCDYALTAQDGKISAVGVFSQINIARLPATHGRCFFVAILEAAPGAHELSFQVISPTGKPTLQQAPRLRIEVPPTATTANIVADVKGMRLEEIGRHRLEVRAGDQVLGTSPFTVNLILRQTPGNA